MPRPITVVERELDLPDIVLDDAHPDERDITLDGVTRDHLIFFLLFLLLELLLHLADVAQVVIFVPDLLSSPLVQCFDFLHAIIDRFCGALLQLLEIIADTVLHLL
ncbi:hypothetical protein [Halopenitus malekzadehii]|uniref:hypothetical protein n=1 Tax=Halopenitus malekzadehii TaxID=1267564 RepID=UPI000B87D5DF|nr:hypothetical protein [Halopenitus malekzadehii]